LPRGDLVTAEEPLNVSSRSWRQEHRQPVVPGSTAARLIRRQRRIVELDLVDAMLHSDRRSHQRDGIRLVLDRRCCLQDDQVNTRPSNQTSERIRPRRINVPLNMNHIRGGRIIRDSDLIV
jgi:hypothetical protein